MQSSDQGTDFQGKSATAFWDNLVSRTSSQGRQFGTQQEATSEIIYFQFLPLYVFFQSKSLGLRQAVEGIL